MTITTHPSDNWGTRLIVEQPLDSSEVLSEKLAQVFENAQHLFGDADDVAGRITIAVEPLEDVDCWPPPEAV